MPTETLMMKISKNTWYGNIPTDWVINKYKFICKISSGDAMAPEDLDDSCEYEVYGGGKLIGFANSYNTQNCILIGRVGANCGCITNISDKCWATDNALILKTSSNKNYMNYLLMASNLNDINESNAQPLITASKVLNFKIPFTCNINEQQAIADFLDEKCEKIDKVIGEIEEQIQVLEDYKKSLITETVTKGIDKNVPMKDSGIDWIGKIPANWDIKKLKYCCRICNGAEYADIEVSDGGYPVMGSGGEFARASKYSYDKESVLLGRKGTIDKPLYVDFPFWAVDTMFYTKINKNMYPKFLYYSATKIRFDYYVTATALPSMTQRDLGSEPLTIPPYNIQMQIADYLDKECAKIDTTINDKKEQLETIKEYKKSLIYEYVTGKKRVAC